MADNTVLNAGTGGDTISTDDIAGVKVQRVKVQYGVDGAATDVSDTNPMPVDDAGGSLTVDNAALSVTGGGVEASALRVTLASDSTGVLSVDDNGGSLTVDVGTALPAGTNVVGDVGISGARTSGGTTIFRSIDLDETEEEIKGTAGQIYWIHAMNLATTVRYLKVYNATAATVVVGTTTPVLTFPIPTAGSTNGAGFNFAVPNGIAFGTAITVAATTGVADNDTGAPGVNEVVVNIGYA